MNDHSQPLLNIYFTAGYPAIDSLHTLLPALIEANVDMVEIGLPYSDPLADGLVIQDAGSVALANGMNLRLLFDQLAQHRSLISSKPIYLMGYYNQILQFGEEAFLDRCQQVGIFGLIIPDLPMEVYEKNYVSLFQKYNIGISFLITPFTSEERMHKADALSTGFVYAVSQASITGTKMKTETAQLDYLQRLSERKWKNKVLLGFGIQDAEGFRLAGRYTDGGIVGSALIKHIAAVGCSGFSIKQFVKDIRGK